MNALWSIVKIQNDIVSKIMCTNEFSTVFPKKGVYACVCTNIYTTHIHSNFYIRNIWSKVLANNKVISILPSTHKAFCLCFWNSLPFYHRTHRVLQLPLRYFYIVWFWTYSCSYSACRNCLNNQADCWRRHCVTADGFEKAILTINRRLPAPSIQVLKHVEHIPFFTLKYNILVESVLHLCDI